MMTLKSQTDRLLVIAPQPFYQERGTPIAVRLLIESLSSFGYTVDLATYHEGLPVTIDRLQIHRIKAPKFLKNIPIGFSLKKIFCDLFLFVLIIRLLRQYRYQTVHAIEESVFLALLLKKIFRFRLVYDVDSSMVEQMVSRFPFLRYVLPVMVSIERAVVRRSDYLFPVCPDLAEKLAGYAPRARMCILQDPPLPLGNAPDIHTDDLGRLSGCNQNILLYVGNLEHYQGVDLVIEAMAKLGDTTDCCFVVIGGQDEHRALYDETIRRFGLESRVHLIGPRPLAALYGYLSQSHILISPRRTGNNTPMKIYSYLASGKPLIATNIKSHTQVLDPSNALLVKPEPDSIAAGIKTLLESRDLRRRLGASGQSLVDRYFSKNAYTVKLKDAYTEIMRNTTN